MKGFKAACIAVVATNVGAIGAGIDGPEEKKVPPRHPIARLNRLVEFSDELIDSWFGFLPS